MTSRRGASAPIPKRKWIPIHAEEWLGDPAIRQCSPMARAILGDLLCIAHGGSPYGHLSDLIGPLTEEYLAMRCMLPLGDYRRGAAELRGAGLLTEIEVPLLMKWVSGIKTQSAIRWDRMRAAGGRISAAIRSFIYDRDGRQCVKCGSGSGLTLDHIHPICKGGTNAKENLQTLCKPCNSSKGGRLEVTD